MTTYQVESSKYARGMAIVAPVDSSPTSPVAKLCEAFSGNRFSYREHGFMMNPVTLKHFMRAAQLGCACYDVRFSDSRSTCYENGQAARNSRRQ